MVPKASCGESVGHPPTSFNLKDDFRADWNLESLTPALIESRSEELIETFRTKFQSISKLSKDEIMWSNCVGKLIVVECDLFNLSQPLVFAQHVSTDESVRLASVKSEKMFNDFEVEIAMDQGIFDNVVHYHENFVKDGGSDKIDPEFKRFIEKTIVNGKRNGLHLQPEVKLKVKELKKKISELGIQFQSNLNEDKTCLWFTKEQLEGVSDDLVDTLEVKDGKYKVTLQYPHYFPVTRKCKVAETRKALDTAYNMKCVPTNVDILTQLVELRRQKAQLLGYASHASFIHEERMAKSPQNVSEFHEDLKNKLKKVWDKERVELLKLKREECEQKGVAFDGELNFWDMRYYTTMLSEKKYDVDQEKLRPYFPLEKVTSGLFEIYQKLLSLKFVEVPKGEFKAWHPDVKLYRVDDNSTSIQSNDITTIGYFFLDLHPREGKYGHACMMALQPGCLDPSTHNSIVPSMDGGSDLKNQVSICAMLTNFTSPTSSKPSLLDHSEVETYFHEFGHVMHQICAKTKTFMFSGCSVERDFVEAPSQMLENWVWKEETLSKYMSQHYESGEALPQDLLKALINSKKANAGSFNLRQIILGRFDQKIHDIRSREGSDMTLKIDEIFADTYKEILGINVIEGTCMPASFGHMVGYDAQYYGYMWSEVFSADMFHTKFGGGDDSSTNEGSKLLDSKVGMEYRTKILRPGSTKDAMDMLTDFLGRKPTSDAFLRDKGLKL